MAKYCTAFVFLLVVKTTTAQLPVFQWAKSFTSDNSNGYRGASNGRTIGTDQQGNVYSAGIFQHTVDFDPGPGVYDLAGGQSDNGIYISKLSPAGEFIWAKQIPSLIEFGYVEMKVDKKGNIYLTASFSGPTDMDPGPGVHLLTSTGFRDAFIIKLNSDGDLIWVKQFGGPGDTGPYGTALDIDQNDNVIVCGSFNNTVDFDPGPNTFNLTSTGNFEAFITKLDVNGDFVWAKKLGNFDNKFGNMNLNDVKCDASGSVYSTGDFSGNCDFDPRAATYTLTSKGPGDAFISKLDANGNFVWAKKFGKSEQNNEIIQPHAIDIDADNNVYTTGAYLGIKDFDPGNGVHNLPLNEGTWNGYLLKLDVDGNFVWANALNGGGSGEGADLALDKAGNIYVTGDFSGTIDFDPGPGSFLIDLYSGSALVKYDGSGDLIYAAVFRNIDWASNLCRRMYVDDSLNIFITGYVAGATDFDPGPNVYPVSGSSDLSPFVLKLSKCKHVTTADLNISTCSSYTLNNRIFDSSGTYTQVIPHSAGCDSIITLHLRINKKFTEQAKAICEGEAFFAGGANQHSSGTYKDTLSSSSGCDSIVTTYLTVNPKPLPDLGPDKGLCSNSTLVVTPGSFSDYLWQDGSTESTFKITAPGLFWVRVTNSFNCSARDSMLVQPISGPADFLKATDSICNNDKLTLHPLSSFNDYLWSTGESQNKIVIDAPGEYWLRVTGTNGCTATDTIVVFPKECMYGVYIPTAFTPNGDGKNDYFGAIVYGRVASFKLQVYNRFGEIVFQTTDPDKKWDGLYKSAPFATTVFLWQCSYQLENQKPTFKKGVVTLLR
jgi:gliding motility-associated-like protein